VRGVDVLFLHGSPGSGKSTLAGAVANRLRTAGTPNAVIDLDDLSLVYPPPRRSFARENLTAIWPNYAAIPGLRVVIPGVIADEQELVDLRECVPGSRFLVCELTAPKAVLTERVIAREPDDYWRERLVAFVELFNGRDDLERIRDFQVSTHDKSIDDTATEVIEKAGWLTVP
jgi:predicted kinase